MRTNYRYYNNCMNNANYERGSEGVSVMGKIKLQNLIKNFNEKIAKKPIEIKTIKGKWNGFNFPVLDKTISNADVARMKKSKKLQKDKNYKQLDYIDMTQEEIIEQEFCDLFNERYPNADIYPSDIISQYCSQGRRASRKMIKRMHALVVAHARHHYTDYDNQQSKGGDTRKIANFYARKVIANWQ